MDLEAFKARFANPIRDILGEDFNKLESFAQIFPSDYYFFRQTYAKGELTPELKPICVCRKFFNVEDDNSYCPSCQEPFHPICMRQHSDTNCFNCKQELPRKLVYATKREPAPLEQGSPSKRQKTEEIDIDAMIRNAKRQASLYSATLNPEEIKLRERKQTREHLAFTLLRSFEKAKDQEYEIPNLSFEVKVNEAYEFCFDVAR